MNFTIRVLETAAVGAFPSMKRLFGADLRASSGPGVKGCGFSRGALARGRPDGTDRLERDEAEPAGRAAYGKERNGWQ